MFNYNPGVPNGMVPGNQYDEVYETLRSAISNVLNQYGLSHQDRSVLAETISPAFDTEVTRLKQMYNNRVAVSAINEAASNLVRQGYEYLINRANQQQHFTQPNNMYQQQPNNMYQQQPNNMYQGSTLTSGLANNMYQQHQNVQQNLYGHNNPNTLVSGLSAPNYNPVDNSVNYGIETQTNNVVGTHVHENKELKSISLEDKMRSKMKAMENKPRIEIKEIVGPSPSDNKSFPKTKVHKITKYRSFDNENIKVSEIGIDNIHYINKGDLLENIYQDKSWLSSNKANYHLTNICAAGSKVINLPSDDVVKYSLDLCDYLSNDNYDLSEFVNLFRTCPAEYCNALESVLLEQINSQLKSLSTDFDDLTLEITLDSIEDLASVGDLRQADFSCDISNIESSIKLNLLNVFSSLEILDPQKDTGLYLANPVLKTIGDQGKSSLINTYLNNLDMVTEDDVSDENKTKILQNLSKGDELVNNQFNNVSVITYSINVTLTNMYHDDYEKLLGTIFNNEFINDPLYRGILDLVDNLQIPDTIIFVDDNNDFVKELRVHYGSLHVDPLDITFSDNI